MSPGYQWPTDVLDPLMAEVRRTSEAWHAASEAAHGAWVNASAEERRELRKQVNRKEGLRLAYYRARERASRAFAAANGWKVGHNVRSFSLGMLREGRTMPRHSVKYAYTDRWDMPPCGSDFDHAEFLKVGRVPVAIICHNYNGAPPAEGLRVEQLPECWYWPEVTTRG